MALNSEGDGATGGTSRRSRRLVVTLLSAGLAAVIVAGAFLLLDEFDPFAFITAVVLCGTAGWFLSGQPWGHVGTLTWWILAAYVAYGYLWLFMNYLAIMSGKPWWAATSVSYWGSLAFLLPTSLVWYAASSLPMGDVNEFLMFALPPLNALVLAATIGSLRLRRLRSTAQGDP